jgi:tRNA modification GTPase
VPNAGKSTLFNLLVGTDRTLVSPRPGTTRDLIEETANFDGYPIRLVDGAGLQDSADEVELEGMKRMRVAAAAAQLVMVLIPPGGEELAEPSWSDSLQRTLFFHSRCDEDRRERCAGPGISAKTGEGIAELISKVVKQLYDVERIPRGEPRLFLPSHRYWIERTIEALESGFDGKEPLSRLHLSEETR